MNLLYIANIRLPTEKAHGAQIMKTCEALASLGVDVELMIPGRRTHIKEDSFWYYGVKRNFRITVVQVPDLIFLGAIGFALTALMFSERVRWRRAFWDANVIYSRDAFVLLQYVLLGRTLVYEAHTKPTFISTTVARHAHRLVVISNGLKLAYGERGVSDRRITVAHDAVDLTSFEKSYEQKGSRKQLGIPSDKKVVMYVGRIDEAKGVHVFAEAGRYVPVDTLYVAIGDGLLKEVLTNKYPSILFLPATKYKDLPWVLAAADVLVIPNSAKDADTAEYTSPMKAFGYMASGKPIVASNVPALREILSEQTAHFVTPDNPKLLADAVQYVLQNLSEAVIRAKRAQVEVANYTWEKRSRIIFDFLRM